MALDYNLNLPKPQGNLEDWAKRFALEVEDRLRRIGVQVQRVRKNSTGSIFGPKTLFNFIEGSNVTLTVADDNINDEVDITIASTGGGGSTHNLLDAGTHLDSVTQTVSIGSLIYGNSTPKWDELTIGGSGTFLRSNGTVPSWAAITDADVPDTITLANLTQITTRNHSDLQGIGANDHHAQSHVLATNLALGADHTMSGATAGHVLRASSATAAAFAQLQHTDLGGVTADQHHAQSHVLATTAGLGADHTTSGLTAGQVLRATGATTAAFQAIAVGDLPAHNLLSTTHGDTLAGTVVRGDIIRGNSTPAWSRLAIGAANRVLRSDGTDPSWAQVALGTDVSGQLPIANGGTGQATALAAFNALSPLTTRGDLLTRNATDNVRLAVGSSGTFLRSDGTDPSWASITDADVPNTITLDNITQITTRSHASLQDLTADDHTQYFLLNGRSGGQSAKGGTAAGDHLNIDPSSTSNYTGSIRVSPNAGDYGSGSVAAIVLWPSGFTHGGGVSQVISGMSLTSTISIDATELLTPINLFRADPTVTNTTSSVSTYGTYIGFSAQPTLNNSQNVAASTGFIYGLQYGPTLSTTGGNTLTVTNLNAVRSVPSAIPSSVTVTTLRHFYAESTSVSGTLTTAAAFDTDISTGSTCLALRSTSTNAEVRVAGAAKYGANSQPDITNGNVFEVERTHTLGASIGDGQAACVVLDPGYSGAFTVTRHNYAKYEDVSVSSSTVTDSCVGWFNAAAGTHKAVDSGTTKTSPGTVSAWLKWNINGTVYYCPIYTSKTT